jgi:hypothetical protein
MAYILARVMRTAIGALSMLDALPQAPAKAAAVEISE